MLTLIIFAAMVAVTVGWYVVVVPFLEEHDFVAKATYVGLTVLPIVVLAVALL